MRFPSISPKAHWVLLVLFALAVFGLIMLPILLMGYPPYVSYTIKTTQILVEDGLIVDTRQQLLLTILSWMHPWISWDNITGWATVSVGAFALSLLPLWWSIRMIAEEKAAWIATVTFAFMPMSWTLATSLGGYCFALLPLFLCFACFLRYHNLRPMFTSVLCGILFGITMGIQHSYIAFLPWFAISYAWVYRRKLKTAIIRVGVFCAIAYSVFLIPMIPNALQEDMTATERIFAILSPMEEKTPGEGHLYPDEFLFENYKEEYDKEIEKRVAASSFIKRQEDRNYRIIFGTGQFTLWDRITTGTWMLLNSLPDFFMMDYIGGAFLWILIIPGIAIMWNSRREILLSIVGLIVVMELLLRYVLLFTSSHLDNYHWALALFAGVGAVSMMQKLTTKQGKATVILCMIIALQMAQANRKVLAQQYAKSNTLEVLAATEALAQIPEDALVASPRRHDLLILSNKAYMSVHPKTIDFLSERGKLAEPFRLKGVTHIIGYTEEQERQIKRVAPYVKVIEYTEKKPELSAFVRYLLNTIR